jgi:4-hydroxybenzoate polyprenyltransferase
MTDRPPANSRLGRSDIPRGWVDSMPRLIQPYLRLMRLDRPIGTWLLLLPGWWSLTLASVGVPDLKSVVLFLIGAVVMRGAGCTYNDIVDRDIDAKVARTATRPLPSGQITPRNAWIFLALQLAVGLAVLLQFNLLAIAVGAASLLLIAAYPFMKRITFWPQAWLGLTFNWGVLVGWAAATGRIDKDALLLYAGGFFWTLGYDTIYAHQDRDDDALIGVKSSARALGALTKPAVAVFYAIALACFATAILPPLMSLPSIALLALTGVQFAWQAATLKVDDPGNCLARFRSNRNVGLLILAAIVLAGR